MASPLYLHLDRALGDLDPGAHIYIAYSGGLDSQALLHAAVKWSENTDSRLTALHVDHGLSPRSGEWQGFCARHCHSLGVVLRTQSIDLRHKAGRNIEHRARQMRYAWFESQLAIGDVLLTAHHREDQAETLVLRLLRASGVRGLAAIPEKRKLGTGWVYRPFLRLSKAELQNYLHALGVDWIEDESNISLEFDRNYIRHQLMPVFEQRWPRTSSQFARSAQNCRDEQGLLDELAQIDADTCRVDQELLWPELMPPLDLNALKTLSKARQRNLLQYLLRAHLHYPAPAEQIDEWLRQINSAGSGALNRLVLGNVALALYDAKLYFLALSPRHDSLESVQWDTSTPLELFAGQLILHRIQRVQTEEKRQQRQLLHAGQSVEVFWRQGGERVRLPGEPFTRSLKKMFQDRRIRPWQRQFMPLILFDGQIVWSGAMGDFSPLLEDENGQQVSFELRCVA